MPHISLDSLRCEEMCVFELQHGFQTFLCKVVEFSARLRSHGSPPSRKRYICIQGVLSAHMHMLEFNPIHCTTQSYNTVSPRQNVPSYWTYMQDLLPKFPPGRCHACPSIHMGHIILWQSAHSQTGLELELLHLFSFWEHMQPWKMHHHHRCETHRCQQAKEISQWSGLEMASVSIHAPNHRTTIPI